MNALKNLLLKNEIRIYLLVALLHAVYAALYVFSPYFEWLFNLLFISLLGNYTDFQDAFPNHYHWLFILSVPARLIAMAAFIYAVNWISRRIATHSGMEQIPSVSMRQLLLRCLRTIAVAFVFYLLAYLLLNLHYKTRSHDYSMLQVFAARGFLLQLSIHILLNCFTHRKQITAYFKKYLLEPALPYNIAILRILFFTYMAFTYARFYVSFSPTIGLTHKSPLPLMGWLVDIIPVNISLFSFFAYAGIVSCLFVIAGYKTRWFLIINAICCFYIVATPNFFGKLWHNQLIIWISWIFTFAKCYDVYSIDSLRTGAAIQKRPDYTFPVRLVWLQFGLIYFWAGFYKLWDSGFDWALSHSMVNQVQLEWLQHYGELPFFRIDRYPFLLYAGGLLVILFELSYFLFVLKKSWRWLAFTGGVIMHNLIGIFLYIFFFAGLWLLYFFYFDFNVFYRKQQASVQAEKGFSYSKAALYSGIFILSMNFLAGMFNIDSYPFSAYPKYSVLIPDQIKIIRFDCGDGTDVHQVGKQNQFRWESYGWLEYGLIKDFEQGKDVRARIADYWEIWTKHNPQLLNRDSVRVFVDIRPVSPEGKDSLKTIGYICTFIPANK